MTEATNSPPTPRRTADGDVEESILDTVSGSVTPESCHEPRSVGAIGRLDYLDL